MDQLYSSTRTGKRNGKQIFTAINLNPENGYGNFNIMPTVKLEYGITHFSNYSEPQPKGRVITIAYLEIFSVVCANY